MCAVVEQGILGIVVGILTTVILYTIKVLWMEKVTPYWRSVKYQGIKVDGQWGGVSAEADFHAEGSLFLIQNAHDLAGSFVFKFKNEQKNFTVDFKVKGYMWEGYLTLNFVPKDRRITSYATALLKLHSGGAFLTGQWLFRNVEEEGVTALPLSLSRIG